MRWVFFFICIHLLSAPYRSTYLERKYISRMKQEEIHTIFEVGSHHARDAVLLERHFNAKVYSFECSPQSIAVCKKTIAEENASVHLIEKAVTETVGPIDFYYIADYPGSSSTYPLSFKSMLKNKQEMGETLKSLKKKYAMQKMRVDSTRLDCFIEGKGTGAPDLLCIDVQGATLPVLKSLGKYINDVKYVICEVEYKQIYEGEPLFDQINAFMRGHGFTCYYAGESDSLWNDVLFVRNDLTQ